jgi:hypothetical protein
LKDTFWDQAALNSVSAAIAFVGVILGLATAGYRENKGRRHTYTQRVADKQFDLYLRYIEVMNRNFDELTGDRRMTDKGVFIC